MRVSGVKTIQINSGSMHRFVSPSKLHRKHRYFLCTLKGKGDKGNRQAWCGWRIQGALTAPVSHESIGHPGPASIHRGGQLKAFLFQDLPERLGIDDVGDNLGLRPSSLVISQVLLETRDGSRLVNSKGAW